MDELSDILIPVTVLGMTVKYVDQDNVVSTKEFPYRKKLGEIRKDFGDPNGYTILEAKSNKQEFSIQFGTLLEKGTYLQTIVNKNGTLYN